MGIIRTAFEFANPANRSLSPVTANLHAGTHHTPDNERLSCDFHANARVDTGAVHLCLPEHLAIQLDLQELEQREVTLANGHRFRVPYCGPVEIRFKNRRCFTGAIIMGDEPLIGAIPMEDLDLVVLPARHTVDVNPASPNIPLLLAK